MDSRNALLAVLLLCCCYAQIPGQSRLPGFMPGTSPATPNLALDMCQRQTAPKVLNVSRSGKHADHVYQWCTVYEGVLPCLGRTLPTANSASDWYLKLIYNQTTALRMSNSLCARFPYISNLTCVDGDMSAVGKCMQWTTKSAADHFYRQFLPREPLTDKKKRLAEIYACIISVATAGCFHKELKSCSAPKRKLMYDFYIMLSGKCRGISGIEETTSLAPEVRNITTAPRQQNVESVPENQVKEKSSFGSGQVNRETPQSIPVTEQTSLVPQQPPRKEPKRNQAPRTTSNRFHNTSNGSSQTYNTFILLQLILSSIILFSSF